MDETYILVNFLEENKGKNIKVFINNGYPLYGQLVNYDDTHLLLRTNAYGHSKEVPVTISAISTFVPY